MIKLRNVERVERHGDKILLVDDELFEIEPYSEVWYRAFCMLCIGCTEDELLDVFCDKNQYLEFIGELKNNGMLVETRQNPFAGTMYEKQWFYLEGLTSREPHILQSNIANATVCIVGIGGVGSVVINTLVRCGVQSFVLIDFDRVNASNLNRQVIYSAKDIGKSKLDCAERYIKSVNPKARVVLVESKIDSIADMVMSVPVRCDIVINAADTPRNIEEIVYRFGEEIRVPVIGCGVGRNYGYWGPLLIPEETRNYDSFVADEKLRMTHEELFLSETESVPANVAFAPINNIVSELLAKDVLLYLAMRKAHPSVLSVDVRCGVDLKNLVFAVSDK